MAKAKNRNWIAGKLFIFTGYFILAGRHLARRHVARVISARGGKAVDNHGNSRKLPKNTIFLIQGRENTTVKSKTDNKVTKSLKTGVTIMSFNKFTTLLHPADKSELRIRRGKKAS